jgi:hypothetical protein
LAPIPHAMNRPNAAARPKYQSENSIIFVAPNVPA